MLHELKTPLTSILLSANALLDWEDGPDRGRERRAIERIFRSARAMQSFVVTMLDRSADGHGVRLSCSTTDVVPIVDEALDIMAPLALERSIRLIRDVADASLRAWCVRSQVLQILLNLISNAVKFSPAETAVTVSARLIDHHARLSVRDEGPGIDAEQLVRLFQPYRRDGRDGHGLGLFISRDLAGSLGGKLLFEPASGKGATFHLTLPLKS